MGQGWTVVAEPKAPPSGWAPVSESAKATQASAAGSDPDSLHGVLNSAADFIRGVWHTTNPIAAVQSVSAAIRDPKAAVQAVGQAQGQLAQKAEESFKKGDYIAGLRHSLAYLLPLIGPGLDASSDKMMEGKYAEGLGEATGIGLQVAVPEAARRMPPTSVRVAPRNPVPAQQAAVEFGLREGIPVDAATATGNPVMRGAQWLSERTAAGSVVGGKARQAQAQGLANTGERMATRAHPTPVTAEQAGQAVRDAIGAKAEQLNADATAAYDRLRAIEQQQAANIAQTGGVQAPATSARPFTTTPMAVDLGPTKAAMQPIYEALKRESELVPLMGDKAKALTALDRLMNAPDTAPLSVADAALSDIKAMSRVDQSFKRTTGQGVAAQAVTSLDRAVVNAARQAGPDALKALMDGRAATINKFKAIDAFDAFGKGNVEPVRVFNALTASKDSAIGLIRRVAREAPQELPKIGRAFLDGLLQKATAEGGFSRADGVFRDWSNMGRETKVALFRDQRLVQDLDQFFLLAKKASENPNPSGTAFTLSVGAQGTALVSNPALGLSIQVGGASLAKLLHNQRFVRAVVNGMRMPVGNRAAATAAVNVAVKAAGDLQLRAAPAMAAEAPSGAQR